MINKNPLIQPVLQWVGGKRQLLPEIEKILPKNLFSNIENYYEPFFGGGAVLFNFQPKKAVINDLNSELINVYTTIKNNINELIFDLSKHKNNAEYYYSIRNLDRDSELFSKLPNVERASRFLFLNKTCFNSLYRVNRLGQNNAAFGSQKTFSIDTIRLRSVSEYFNMNHIEIKNVNYSECLKTATSKDFVYLDSPYYPLKDGSDFTKYNAGGWKEKDHQNMFLECKRLNENGIPFLMSNSASDYIRDTYKEFNQKEILASRKLTPKAEDRKNKVSELLIYNY